jgi:predicted nucleotidyltransferase
MTLPDLDEKASSVLTAFTEQSREKLSDDLVMMKLFGSRARGEKHEWSDLDILFVLKDYTRKNEIFDLLFSLDPDWDYRISPVILSLHEYEKNREIDSPFINELERDGIDL